MDTLKNPNKKPLQSIVPFLSGSQKYLHPFTESPGPGSYIKPDEFPKPPPKHLAPFNSTQVRSYNLTNDSSPGPGSYNLISRKKLSPIKKPRKKIVYNSNPSFPSKTLVYQNEILPSKFIDSVKIKNISKSSLKGVSFPKALRMSKFDSNGNLLGPGFYDVRNKEGGKGITFGKSEKKYGFVGDICKESYLKETDLTGFLVKKVPRKLQNFGNRCERVLVDIKDSIGPGYYEIRSSFGLHYGAAPFNCSEMRFRSL